MHKKIGTLLGICLIFSACSEKDPDLDPKEEKDPFLFPQKEETKAPSNKNPKGTPVRPQEVRTNLMSEPPSLDPRLYIGESSDSLLRMLFSGLTYRDPDHVIKLDLAASYGVSRDQKSYTFFLKDNFWSDGSRLTAFDFVETWTGMLAPTTDTHVEPLFIIKNAQRAKQGEVSKESIGLRALDPHTLVIELEHPETKFLDLLSDPPFYPVHKSMRNTQASYNNIVSSGPFKLIANPPKSQIVIEKNPFYWNASEIRLDKILYYIIYDEEIAKQMLEKGDLDCLSQVSNKGEIAFEDEATATLKGIRYTPNGSLDLREAHRE